MRRAGLLLLAIACGGRLDPSSRDAGASDATAAPIVVDCPAAVGVAPEPLWAVAHWGGVPYGLAVTPTGRVLVSGSIRGDVDLGGGPLASTDVPRPFVLLLDANGKYLASSAWKAFDGPPNLDTYTSVAVDRAGGFWIGFSALGPRTFGSSVFDAGPADVGVYIVHLDDDAIVQSAFRFPATPTPEHRGTVLALRTNSQPGFTLSGAGPVDWGAPAEPDTIFVGRYDGLGKLGAHATVPASYGPAPGIPLEDGGFVTTFDFDKSVVLQGRLLTSKGGPDIGVARFDASGKLGWVTTIGGTDNDVPLPLTRLENGNILVGSFELSADVELGDGRHSVGRDKDGALIELSPNGTVASITRLGTQTATTHYATLFDTRSASGGDVLVGGHFLYELALGNVVLRAPTFRGFVARRRPSGEFAWARCFSDSGLTLVYGFAEMPDAGTVAAIYSHEPLDFGSGPIVPAEPKPSQPTTIFTVVRFPR